ncbi:hypothetical protein [Micromonospora profundi]|uniref:hypothetical protein n=1 Tax=Micromonospora profundi TaxID=1420889 RepID=UPI003653E528
MSSETGSGQPADPASEQAVARSNDRALSLQVILGQSAMAAAILYSYGLVEWSNYWGGLTIGRTLRPNIDVFEIMKNGMIPFLVFLLSAGASLAIGAAILRLPKKRVETKFLLLAAAGITAVLPSVGRVGYLETWFWLSSALALILVSVGLYSHAEHLKVTHGPRADVLRILAIIAVAGSLMSSYFVGYWYAAVEGVSSAKQAARERPTVTIYSPGDLQLPHPGIQVTLIPDSEPFKVKYEYLKLIVRGDDFVLVVGPDWNPGEPYSIVPTESLRLDIDVDG